MIQSNRPLWQLLSTVVDRHNVTNFKLMLHTHVNIEKIKTSTYNNIKEECGRQSEYNWCSWTQLALSLHSTLIFASQLCDSTVNTGWDKTKFCKNVDNLLTLHFFTHNNAVLFQQNIKLPAYKNNAHTMLPAEIRTNFEWLEETSHSRECRGMQSYCWVAQCLQFSDAKNGWWGTTLSR